MPHRYIVKEAIISAVINGAASGLIFMGLFGLGQPVAIWGRSGLWIDLAPQSFVVSTTSILVPALLAKHRLRNGGIEKCFSSALLPRALWRRTGLAGIVCPIAVVGLAGIAFRMFELQFLPAATALALKIAVGIGLALLVTPPGLRAELCR